MSQPICPYQPAAEHLRFGRYICRMTTLDDIRNICLGFPRVTTSVKWEDHLCFEIGGKFFLVTAPDSVPVSATFKVTDEDFESTASLPGCKPAPYLARYKWVHVDDVSRFTPKEWEAILQTAYRLIGEKLPVKRRKELGLP